ncbi:unnamed protein product [Prorocentrum cordatum]|uniref:Polynucleotide adenylyltransferase n=1 Tax=Prorocentrum cordatum TaxID=2364126 RepID=A0ABN9Y7L6_9DINO|nr:unnamed protein product [Polarella glacialis]
MACPDVAFIVALADGDTSFGEYDVCALVYCRWPDRSKAIVSWLLDEYEHARSVTLVLKQWLIERTYGTSHTGGLCSYGLLLMVVGFLQLYPADSAATALVGVLNFYGRVFDPQLYGVSVARGALLHRKSPAAWPPAQARYVESGFCPGASEFDALSHGSMLTRED